jgi:hypothetical protein
MFQTLQSEDFLNGRVLDGLPALADRVYDHTKGSIDPVNGNDLILKTGWAVTLDGVANYVTVPHSASYDISGKRVRIKILFRPTSITGATRMLISKGNPSSAGGWELLIHTDGTLFFGTIQASVNSFHSRYQFGAAVLNQWNSFEIILDNQVVTSANFNGVTTFTQTVAPTGTYGGSTLPLSLGQSGAGFWFFAGDISGFSVQDLDADYLISLPLQDHPPGSLDGLPAFDASGNGNHGTYVGGTSINGEGIPDIVAKLGDYEDKMWSDGVDDQVAFGAGIHTTLSGASIFTLELTTAYLDTTTANKVWYMTSGASEGCFTVRFNSASSLTVISRSETADAFGSITFTHSRNVNSEILDWRFEADYGLGKIRVYCDGVLEDTLTPANWTSATFDMIGSVILGHSTGRIKGGVWDVRVKKDGVPVGQWQGDGNTNADWLDQIGSNNGTVSGSPATVADLRRTIPQTALQDWNRRMWFDGEDDSSDTDFQITASNFGIYFKNIYIPSSLSDSILFASKGGLGLWVQILSGVLQLQFRGAGVLSTGYTLPLSEFYDLAIEYAPTTYTIKKDGITVKTGTFAGTVTNPGQVFTVGSYNSGRYFKGYIERITFTQSDVFVGEWVNSTASFVGSPANIYLPEASDNPGFDALGNAIANPRGELLNPRGVAGDYAEILDDPSLDVTTEWSGAIVGNLWDDGALNRLVLHRDDFTNSKKVFNIAWRSSADSATDGRVRFILSSTGAVNAWSGRADLPNRNSVLSWSYNGTAGTFKVYIDGAETTVTTVFGTIPASLFTTDIPIRLFQDFNGASPSDKQIGKTLMYNKALSDSEHVKIYRALRRYL